MCGCQPGAIRVYSVSHSGSCSSPRFTMKKPQECMPQEGFPTPTLTLALHPARLLAILICFVTPSFMHLLILALLTPGGRQIMEWTTPFWGLQRAL